MTETLYLTNSYMKECDATVLEVLEGKYVVLDRTIFYPRGGGQPGDSGVLTVLPEGLDEMEISSRACGQRPHGLEFRVLNVMKKEGKILHEIESKQDPGSTQNTKPETQNRKLETGNHLRCALDWEKRYRLMRMHTAAHVLGATMHNELGVLITGNELGVDKTRFDFSLESFDRQKFEDIVKKANESLALDLELKIYSLPREKAMEIPGIVKLAGALPPNIKELRIVEIPGIDTQADGGTHVKNLKEVGQIELIKLENKGSVNKRIYFGLKP